MFTQLVSTGPGLRRRGYTPASIREFCKVQGVTKNKNTTPFAKLERCIRMELESTAKRVYAVVDPIKVRTCIAGDDTPSTPAPPLDHGGSAV